MKHSRTAGIGGRREVVREGQRGFALLVIFLMAAAIALMLYVQMPRVAFETEREKESLLMDRGNQYKRAIQLYYAAFQRYPAKIEDLENTNDKRFLRRRYVNPYTGKDDWRLVHINGGVLTDSLVQKPTPAGGNPAGGAAGGSQLAGASTSPTATPPPLTTAANGTDPSAPAPVNQAVLQRPSDRTLPNNGSYNQTAAANPFPNAAPGQFNSFQPYPPSNQNYNDPSTFPPMSLYPNGYNAPPVTQQGGVNQPGLNQPGLNQPGLNQPGLNQPGQNQQGLGFNQPGLNTPGTIQPGTQNPGQPVAGGLPGGYVPGLQTPPGINPNFANQVPTNTDPNNINASLNGGFNGGTNTGVNNLGFGQSPVQQTPPGGVVQATPGGGAPNNQAINLINQLLTTPRQAPAGIGPSTGPATTTGGAGIAGVASSYTGPSILSYGGRTEFEEWEFVWQPNAQNGTTQATQNPNGQNSPNGTPGQNTPNGTTPTMPPVGLPPGFMPGLPGQQPLH